MTKRKTKITLNELVLIFRQMTATEWKEDRLCGRLVVSNESSIELLSVLLDEDNAEEYPCTIASGDPDSISVGDAFDLRFAPVRTAIGRIVPTLDSLLSNSEVAAGIARQPWYIHEIDLASWEIDSDVCRRLNMVCRLVGALEGAASIFDHRSSTLVFLRSNGRFDIPIRYAASDLMQMDLERTEDLIRLLSVEDGHSEQRDGIAATAVCELLGTAPAETRFAEMLHRVGELHRRFVEGYKLFASSFSYEKLRDEVEGIRIEYAGKIHKTISDIQGQLLGIPISTVVVATQFKPIGTAPGQVWINAAIIVGAAIFFVLFCVAVLNQLHTVGVIESEIERRKKALRASDAGIADRLDGVFSSLSDRALWHRIGLIVSMAICFFGLLTGFAVFWIFNFSSVS